MRTFHNICSGDYIHTCDVRIIHDDINNCACFKCLDPETVLSFPRSGNKFRMTRVIPNWYSIQSRTTRTFILLSSRSLYQRQSQHPENSRQRLFRQHRSVSTAPLLPGFSPYLSILPLSLRRWCFAWRAWLW